jgi:hypothetical protein
MLIQKKEIRLPAVVASLLFLLVGMSTALADQVTLSYIDAGSNAQTLSVDANSSTEDLALAASLMGEDGVGVSHDPNSGSGSLADIAAAMAATAPIFAASVAQTLSTLSPEDAVAIVAAVNAVPGVNTNAVAAAVHFGPNARMDGPQVIGSDSAISLKLTVIEKVPSRN